MSFTSLLLAGEEEEPQVTLEIALALIEECNRSNNVSRSYSADESDSRSADAGSLDDLALDDPASLPSCPDAGDAQLSTRCQVTASGAPSKGKRKRTNAEHVARHRERKKAEVVKLKTQIGDLETTLAQMQARQLNRSEALDYLIAKQQTRVEMSVSREVVAQPPLLSVWLDVAASEARKRRKSEVLNTKLKEATARQLKVIRALEDILGKKATVHGLDLLMEEQQQEVRWSRLIAQEDRVFQELCSGLKQMYFVADSLFEPRLWPNAPETVSCTTRLKTDTATGSYVEVQTCTPLRVTFRKTGQASWDRLCDLSVGFDENYHLKRREITETSFQKCYTLIVPGPDRQPLELRGVSFVEMVEEDARMVWMWRSLIVTRDSNGPRFLEKGWTISESANSLASPSSSTAAAGSALPSTSVFRTCYQVSCDSRGDFSTHDPQTNYLIETVLRSLSSRIRTHHQRQQQELLETYARRNHQHQQPEQHPGHRVTPTWLQNV